MSPSVASYATTAAMAARYLQQQEEEEEDDDPGSRTITLPRWSALLIQAAMIIGLLVAFFCCCFVWQKGIVPFIRRHPVNSTPPHQRGPSPEQVAAREKVVKEVLSVRKWKSSSDEETCPICLTDYVARDTVSFSSNPNCEHVFHSRCIQEWLSKKDECPLCRNLFLPEVGERFAAIDAMHEQPETTTPPATTRRSRATTTRSNASPISARSAARGNESQVVELDV